MCGRYVRRSDKQKLAEPSQTQARPTPENLQLYCIRSSTDVGGSASFKISDQVLDTPKHVRVRVCLGTMLPGQIST